GTGPVLAAETWLQDVQLLVARGRGGDPGGPALAVKGGHNDEAHNHLDVGSYLVALDGAPVLIDLGQPTYTARTFTERRYEIWTMTSSWHNLPEIRGHQQGVGERFRAVEVQPELQETGTAEALGPGPGSALHLELREAYPAAAGLRSWRRTAALDRDARTVRISDTWELEARSGHEDVPAVLLRHVIAGDPLEHAPGLLRVRTLSGTVAELRWEAELGTGALERREIDDPLLAASWGGAVHRLSLEGAERGRAALTVTALGPARAAGRALQREGSAGAGADRRQDRPAGTGPDHVQHERGREHPAQQRLPGQAHHGDHHHREVQQRQRPAAQDAEGGDAEQQVPGCLGPFADQRRGVERREQSQRRTEQERGDEHGAQGMAQSPLGVDHQDQSQPHRQCGPAERAQARPPQHVQRGAQQRLLGEGPPPRVAVGAL